MSNDDDGAQKPKDVRLVARPGGSLSFSLRRARRPDYKWNMNEPALWAFIEISRDNKFLLIMTAPDDINKSELK